MKALVLDSETTGLIDNHVRPLDKQPEITELYMALVDLSDGTIHDEFSSLFKPSAPLSDEVKRITHMTDDLFIGAPLFAKEAKNIREWIEDAPKDAIIAHNASFDMEMLQFEFERLNQSIKFVRPICTVEQTIHLKGYRLGLMALHELLFGEPFKEAHRAGPDTMALIRVSVELFKRGLI